MYLVPRSINTMMFVASATASSSRNDDLTGRADGGPRKRTVRYVKEAGGTRLRVAQHWQGGWFRCCSRDSMHNPGYPLDLPSQAPSANVIVFIETPNGPAHLWRSAVGQEATSRKTFSPWSERIEQASADHLPFTHFLNLPVQGMVLPQRGHWTLCSPDYA